MGEPSLDALPVAVARIDRDLRVVWGNARLAAALERPRDVVLGQTCRELGMAGEQYSEWAEQLVQCFEDGQEGRYIHLTRIRGEMHLVDYRFVPEASADARTEFVLAVAYVNQEAEELRAVLASQHQLVRGFLRSAPVLAWLRDEEGRYLLVNDAYKAHYGFRDEDIIGQTVHERWPKEIGERFAKSDRLVTERREVQPSLEIAPHPDGTLHTFEAVKFPIRDESGALHVGGIAIDVTHRMQMAKTLGNLERIRDLAMHTAGVVHDLNNDLFVITATLDSLEAGRGEPTLLLADLRTATDRAITRLREIREQPSGEPDTSVPVRLDEVAVHTVEALAGVLSADLDVVVAPVTVDSEVLGAASGLQRVVENLLLNASDAGARQVQIVLSRTESRHGTPMVVLRVTDDGPGIASDLVDSLFEPFASSKGERRGLGLAGARAVARRHGGELRVTRTAPGEGAVFELRIPARGDSPD